MVFFFWIGFPGTGMVTGTQWREMRPEYKSVRQAGRGKTASNRSFVSPGTGH